MTSSSDAMRQLFTGALGSFDSHGVNLPEMTDIYPDTLAPVVRHEDDGGFGLAMQRWGWPPFGTIKRPITNVRNLTSPFWISALRQTKRRCLVPVNQFCEWSERPDPATGRKRKHWFGLTDHPLFAFAGIWRPGDDADHFAFLTCAPNTLVGPVHPKAMPVILTGEAMTLWMQADWEEARHLAIPYPDAGMIEIAG